VSSQAPRRILVYDVGGSHVAAAVCYEYSYALDGISRAPLPEPNPNPFSAASFGRLIHTLGETALASADIELSSIAGAGFAFPGPFDYKAGVSQMTHKLHSLFGLDLKTSLSARFGWSPEQVSFGNDADSFLLGELAAGAARGYNRAVGLTLGTGIGSAFAVNGKVVVDGPGVPPGGEIWNLPYRDGIIEDYVSTRFLRQQFEHFTGLSAEVATIAEVASKPVPCPDPNLGDDSTSASPAKGDDGGDPHCRARQSFAEFGRHLGLALNQALASDGVWFAPDVIVLGGGIARAAQLFLPETRKALSAHPKLPVLAVSTLMEQAALVGAGVHWFAN
jgi:glucokinase